MRNGKQIVLAGTLTLLLAPLSLFGESILTSPDHVIGVPEGIYINFDTSQWGDASSEQRVNIPRPQAEQTMLPCPDEISNLRNFGR